MKAVFLWLLVKLGEQTIRQEEGVRRIPPPREFDNVKPPPHKNPFSVRVRNLLWETALGISTHGRKTVDRPDAYHYGTMSYASINRILRFLHLSPSDVFVDIGSGKGRVLCCAGRFRVKSVEGVEFSADLHADAEENIVRLRGRKSPIRSHNISAEEFDYSRGTVFMMFNPFGEATMRKVIMRIGASLRTHPRSIRIVYANPLHESVCKEMPWLLRYEHWPKNVGGTEHAVSFYRSVL